MMLAKLLVTEVGCVASNMHARWVLQTHFFKSTIDQELIACRKFRTAWSHGEFGNATFCTGNVIGFTEASPYRYPIPFSLLVQFLSVCYYDDPRAKNNRSPPPPQHTSTRTHTNIPRQIDWKGQLEMMVTKQDIIQKEKSTPFNTWLPFFKTRHSSEALGYPAEQQDRAPRFWNQNQGGFNLHGQHTSTDNMRHGQSSINGHAQYLGVAMHHVALLGEPHLSPSQLEVWSWTSKSEDETRTLRQRQLVRWGCFKKIR